MIRLGFVTHLERPLHRGVVRALLDAALARFQKKSESVTQPGLCLTEVVWQVVWLALGYLTAARLRDSFVEHVLHRLVDIPDWYVCTCVHKHAQPQDLL